MAKERGPSENFLTRRGEGKGRGKKGRKKLRPMVVSKVRRGLKSR